MRGDLAEEIKKRLRQQKPQPVKASDTICIGDACCIVDEVAREHDDKCSCCYCGSTKGVKELTITESSGKVHVCHECLENR